MTDLDRDLRALSTESAASDFQFLDRMSVTEILEIINRQDSMVASAVQAQLPRIAKVVEAAVEALNADGRIVYIGAGTSGRLGVLDAVECGPTFNAADRVVAVMAGGAAALFVAVEGAEDDRNAARKDLAEIGLNKNDLLVGLAASGRTPYVIAGIEYARELGCRTAGLSCNVGSELSSAADIAIEVDTGPEVIAGSTRMKAATAQKMVLNMISSTAMVRIGKTFGNMMSDLRITNGKLLKRGVRIVAQVTGVPEEVAASVLESEGFDVRKAVQALAKESH